MPVLYAFRKKSFFKLVVIVTQKSKPLSDKELALFFVAVRILYRPAFSNPFYTISSLHIIIHEQSLLY
ncbi:hypothetical protein MMJ63_24825, partial [Bacillus vallismortis]|nr:hypothetical protein [Bacillus vallismortis]